MTGAGVRVVLERVLRGIAVAALMGALVRSVWPAAGGARTAVTTLAIDARTADSGAGMARVIGNAIADARERRGVRRHRRRVARA